jgi:nuclear pore complex protein Nup155
MRQPNFGQPLGGRAPPGPSPNDPQPNPQLREIPRPVALQPIQRAARTINEVLQREASFPDLDSYVKRELCLKA